MAHPPSVLSALPADPVLIIFFLLIIASFVAYQAHLRGKNPWLWFTIGFFFGLLSPVFLLYFSAPSNEESPNQEGRSPDGLPSMKVLMPDESLQSTNKDECMSETVSTQDEALWYYVDGQKQQRGPVSVIALRDLWNRGELELSSYVWTKGMEQWQKVGDLPTLKKQLSSTSST